MTVMMKTTIMTMTTTVAMMMMIIMMTMTKMMMKQKDEKIKSVAAVERAVVVFDMTICQQQSLQFCFWFVSFETGLWS